MDLKQRIIQVKVSNNEKQRKRQITQQSRNHRKPYILNKEKIAEQSTIHLKQDHQACCNVIQSNNQAIDFQSCKMSQIWQIYLCKNIEKLG